MATFLNLQNELLRELNMVVLNSANFGSAVGVQAHTKDSVNRAYLDIVNEEPQWPFLATAESGATDPMYVMFMLKLWQVLDGMNLKQLVLVLQMTMVL